MLAWRCERFEGGTTMSAPMITCGGEHQLRSGPGSMRLRQSQVNAEGHGVVTTPQLAPSTRMRSARLCNRDTGARNLERQERRRYGDPAAQRRHSHDASAATGPARIRRLVKQLFHLPLGPGQIHARGAHTEEGIDHVVSSPHEGKQGIRQFQRIRAQHPDAFPSQTHLGQ